MKHQFNLPKSAILNKFIAKSDFWEKLNIALGKKEFIKRLEEIRAIRNEVMHFKPNGIQAESLELLRTFTDFLKKLRSMGAL